MRKKWTYLCIVAFTFGIPNAPAYGLLAEIGRRASAVRLQMDCLPVGMYLTVRLRHNTSVTGKLMAVSTEDFELSTPEPVLVKFTDVKGMSEALGGQPSGNSQNSSGSHHNNFRVLVIALVLGLAFIIFAAVALR